MKTIDRLHHVCLTVSSENFEETWPKELAFFADFLRMNTYKIDVREMDEEITLQGLEQGMGTGASEASGVRRRRPGDYRPFLLCRW